MNKWLSMILVFALCCTPLFGDLALAFADEADGVEAWLPDALDDGVESIAAEAGEALPGELSAFELSDDVEGESALPEAEPEDDAAEIPYARLIADADILSEDGQAIAAVTEGAVLLLTGEPKAAGVPVAFNTVRGVVEGCVDEAALEALTASGYEALMDALAGGDGAVAYHGDINRLLPEVDCTFADPADPDIGEDAAEEVAPVEEPQDDLDEDEETANGAAADDPTEAADEDEPTGVTAEGEPVEAAEEDEPTEEADDTGVDDIPLAEASDGEDGGDSETELDEPQAPAHEPGIEVSTTLLVLGKGEVYRGLTARVYNAEGIEDPEAVVSWKSNKTKYVKVSADGVVTAVATGSTSITVSSEGYPSVPVSVTVKKAPSSVTVKVQDTALIVGGETTVSATVNSGAASGVMTYESSDAGVLEVDPQTGAVRAVGKGTALVTARAYKKSKSVEIKVYGVPAQIEFVKNNVKVALGETEQIHAVLQDADGDATLGAMTAQVADGADCASVDAATGAVTGLALGEAQVTFTANDYPEVTGTCGVRVVNAPKALAFDREALTISVKEVYTGIAVSVIPMDEGGEAAATVTFTSSKPKVAKVTKVDNYHCIVTGVKAGTADIIATPHSGEAARLKITVKKAPSKVSATLSSSKLIVGESATLTAKANTASGTYTFTSSNDECISVEVDGNTATLTARAKGEATITVKTYNGKKTTAKLRVYGVPDQIGFKKNPVLVAEGEAESIVAVLEDSDGEATLGVLTAAVTAGNDCLSVDPATGKVTGLAKGEGVVTFTSDGEVPVTGECAVHVVPAPMKLEFNKESVTIGVKEAYRGAVISMVPQEGESEAAATVTFKSNNTKVAKVTRVDNYSCIITGVKAGTAKITATPHAGGSATLIVNVKKAPSKVYVAPAPLKLIRGETGTLTASANTASGAYTFESADASVVSVENIDGPVATISAIKKGETTVTVKAYNGKATAARVEVYGEAAYIDAADSLHIIAEQLKPSPVVVRDADGDATIAPFAVEIDPASDDPDCISVDPDTGVITGVREGRAVLNYRVDGCEPVSCQVDVATAPDDISLTRGNFTMGLTEVYDGLGYELQGPDGCEAVVSWTSKSPKVVSVTQTETGCVLKGIKTGKSVITATTHNGKSASITVTVANKPTKVTLNPKALDLSVGMTLKITPSVGSGTGCARYTFESADPEIASVDENGNVTAGDRPGESTTITVYSYITSKKATATVKVWPAPEAVELDQTSIDVMVGHTAKLIATAKAGGETTPANFRFTSDSDCVEVNAVTGEIKGVSKGTAHITATVDRVGADETLAAVCKVTVYGAVSYIEMDDREKLNAGSTYSIVPTAYDVEGGLVPATAYKCTYKSDNVRATVDENGNVTGVSAGLVHITVTLSNGGKVLLTEQRSLVIHQRLRVFAAYGYYGSTSDRLHFTRNNARGVIEAFSHVDEATSGLKYVDGGYTEVKNRSQVQAVLGNAASGSKDTDLTIVYLCSHGRKEGSRYEMYYPGYTSTNMDPNLRITDQEILEGLKGIKGKVLLILDSCYSGVFITHMKSQLNALNGKIAVMTAANATKACYYTGSEADGACDYFTHSLLQGVGYMIYNDKNGHNVYKPENGMPADSSKVKGEVTMSEFFNYGKSKAKAYIKKYKGTSALHGDTRQNPQFYSTGFGDLTIYGR